MRRAFTMIELVFVVVVIGILAGIAIPKFAATRDDAIVSKARATVGAARSALATERQKRILRGKTDLSVTDASDGNFTVTFGSGSDATSVNLLEYSVRECPSSGEQNACWEIEGGSTPVKFIFHDAQGNTCQFYIDSKGRLLRDNDHCDVAGMKDL